MKKSAFFYDADTGAKLGQWTLPRPQTAAENCTIHNYNVVPLRDGRYVMVGGHYQAGSWVVDFTNPAAPLTLGWSDPPPAVPTQLGGAWSTYWYNGLLYESVIQEGLNIFRFTGPETRSEMRVNHLNPQTQEFSLDRRGKGKANGSAKAKGKGQANGLAKAKGEGQANGLAKGKGKGKGLAKVTGQG